jgi:hypothetical protein
LSNSFANGAVSVTSTATLVCTVRGVNDGVLVQNSGATDVYLGGPSVTASGATQGVKLAAGATVTVPTSGPYAHNLYAITASSTSTVAYLFPL